MTKFLRFDRQTCKDVVALFFTVSPDFIYFTTFEKKRKVRSPLPTQPNFLVFGITYVYIFCVEVFEKTISRTEIIDHSFER